MATHKSQAPAKPNRKSNRARRMGIKAIPPGMPVKPTGLSKAAASIWDALGPELVDQGRLTAIDGGPFRVLCDLQADVEEARRHLDAEGKFPPLASGKPCRKPSQWWIMYVQALRVYRTAYEAFTLTPRPRAQCGMPSVEAEKNEFEEEFGE
jgi:phage terminase small subunit